MLKRGWKALAGVTALAAVGCAHAPPPQELLDARAAYQEVSTSPQGRERPRDVAAARDALLEAEREYDRSQDSPRTRSLSYVALRKAETAGARGTAELAARRQAEAQAALQQAQARRWQRSQAELDAARQQLAQAERERLQALQQQQQARNLAVTQQREAERMRLEAQRRQQAAEQLRQVAQAQEAEARRLAEKTTRLQQEEQRRMHAEAESQRLAQENHELLQRTAELEAEQEARRMAEQALERERQARLDAEQRATEALTRLESTTQDVKVREESRGLVLTLSGQVLFASNAVDLLPAAREQLTEVASALKETDSPMLIEGHTDSLGTDAMNEALSYRRAERVREFLISQGVSRDRIEVRGLGEYRPVANNSTPEGRANNRRVEIILPRGEEAVGGSGLEAPRPEDARPPR
ncbi:OmpA family protein [Corallococcus macrosporus]|uniref:OmpA family protein n=1 Tax=Myxococcus fulvus (strain ATCC BAA-855 / HW-1) TaxID=483219 RepID=F8CA67_MYXFH|nr:OmpA family protein [Corallococcus macrosporus]AEI63317.1 OmpA family protein [Corallococcus macrosporus]